MIQRRSFVAGTAVAIALPSLVHAQASGGQIRLVVPYGPGGSTDTAGRVLAERMSSDMGKTIVVENRPGGGTMVGMVNIAKSKPDGTSLMVLTTTAALRSTRKAILWLLTVATIASKFYGTAMGST